MERSNILLSFCAVLPFLMSRADQPQFKNITLPDLVSLPETCPKQSELDRFVQQLRQYDRSLKEMHHQINHNIANIDPLTNAVKTEVVTDQHKVSLTHGGTIKINAKHMAADPQVVRRNENNQSSGLQQSKESPNLKSSSILPLVKNKISTAEGTPTGEKSIFNDEDSSFIVQAYNKYRLQRAIIRWRRRHRTRSRCRRSWVTQNNSSAL